ncbi:MAG: septal ring lytic transglycosylase RlpA family protein [Chitinophagaceae bacterium]
MKSLLMLLISTFLCTAAMAQAKDSTRKNAVDSTTKKTKKPPKTLFGTASYYADKFNGRKTASGEVYSHTKPTAACNVLPLGTWVRVTNLKNKRSIVVKINDRMHPRMKRVVDLSRSSAEKLGYTSRGLTQVKVEVLGRQKPKDEM